MAIKNTKKATLLKKTASEKKPVETTGAAQMVELRSSFYRTASKAMTVGIIASSVAAAISAFSLYVAVNTDEIVKFVAVNEEGKIVKLVPLRQPNMTDEAVMQWATQALVETFTMSAFDINYRLNESTSKYFTKEGKEAFLKAFKDTGNFQTIVDGRLFTNIALEHAPIILGNEIVNNRFYAWNIMANAKLTYRNGKDTWTNTVKIELMVTRRNGYESQAGLGIYKIVWTNIE